MTILFRKHKGNFFRTVYRSEHEWHLNQNPPVVSCKFFVVCSWLAVDTVIANNNKKGKRATALVYRMQFTKSAPTYSIAQQYQRNLYIIEKYFRCATIPRWLRGSYLHSFSRCCLPNMPTSEKFRENLKLPQFKVIQGRWVTLVSIESAYAHMRLPISH